MTTYEELLKLKQEVDEEIKELEKEIWGLDEIGEDLLLEPPSLEQN